MSTDAKPCWNCGSVKMLSGRTAKVGIFSAECENCGACRCEAESLAKAEKAHRKANEREIIDRYEPPVTVIPVADAARIARLEADKAELVEALEGLLTYTLDTLSGHKHGSELETPEWYREGLEETRDRIRAVLAKHKKG